MHRLSEFAAAVCRHLTPSTRARLYVNPVQRRWVLVTENELPGDGFFPFQPSLCIKAIPDVDLYNEDDVFRATAKWHGLPYDTDDRIIRHAPPPARTRRRKGTTDERK